MSSKAYVIYVAYDLLNPDSIWACFMNILLTIIYLFIYLFIYLLGLSQRSLLYEFTVFITTHQLHR